MQLLQTPLMQPPVGQDWQPSPLVPQAASLLPGMHTPPAQQPDAHETPSQTQAPPRQCRPVPQGAPVPHRQLPSAEQASAAMASQVTQAAPLTPQVARARGRQTPPAQQPSGQEVASQPAEASFWQVDEQPSPETGLPSSHCSMGERTT